MQYLVIVNSCFFKPPASIPPLCFLRRGELLPWEEEDGYKGSLRSSKHRVRQRLRKLMARDACRDLLRGGKGRLKAPGRTTRKTDGGDGKQEAPHCAFKGMTAASKTQAPPGRCASCRRHVSFKKEREKETQTYWPRYYTGPRRSLPTAEAVLLGLRCVSMRGCAWLCVSVRGCARWCVAVRACARWCVARGSLGASQSVRGRPDGLGKILEVTACSWETPGWGWGAAHMLGEPSTSSVGSLGQRPRPGDSVRDAARSIAIWENGRGEKPFTVCHYPKEASISQKLLF